LPVLVSVTIPIKILSANTNGLTESEISWLKKKPEIRVGYDPEMRPFEFRSADGNFEGIASEYLNIVAEKNGLKTIIAEGLTWPECMQGAREKKIDVLPCVGITSTRKDFLIFSDPYIRSYRAILTRYDDTEIFSLKDLRGKTVAVQEESSHYYALLQHKEINPSVYPSFSECLDAVIQQKADASVGNAIVAIYWLKKRALKQIKIAAPASSDEITLHFAVRDDWPELVSIINKTLKTISDTERASIHDKWIQIDIDKKFFTNWEKMVQQYKMLFAVVAIFSALSLFWIWILLKEIKQRKEAQKKVEELSITDELTKLNNRRHFNSVLSGELARAARKKKLFCLLMLDLDYFKKYNDTYGHQEGDSVLEKTGRLLKNILKRPDDYGFRIGGEEFAVIFFPDSEKSSIEFAEKIRTHIKDLKIIHENNSAAKYVTASIGIVCAVPGVEKNTSWFYKRADEALYDAKEKGRNLVRVKS